MLSEEESRHVARALRLKGGHPVVLVDGVGSVYSAEIESLGKIRVICRVMGPKKVFPKPDKSLVLVQSILKRESMDWLVEKSAELGVSRLVPVTTDRTVVKAGGNFDRWKKIAVSACKQSECPWLMEVGAPMALKEWLKQSTPKGSLRLLCLERSPCTVKACLQAHGRTANPVMFLIGPEGGFTPQESSLVLESGFQAVGLGPQVLRAETAALTLLNFIRYEWL